MAKKAGKGNWDHTDWRESGNDAEGDYSDYNLGKMLSALS